MIKLDSMISQTESWATQIVKQDISPFARKNLDRGSVRYTVIEQTNSEDVLIELVKECEYLTNNSGDEAALLLIPNAFYGFDEFVELVDLANTLLIEQGFVADYKLAHFHPEHRFVGEPQSNSENDTNRSPYPCLYIIKSACMEYETEASQLLEPKQAWWEKPVKYANLMLAIGTVLLALGSGELSRLMMVPVYLGIYFSIK
ncbi:MAG: DUF1415 domain-containing protein [Psychromonas sp.]|nr:DUF1415 domain-containing protein [Alteromonadales bacterium]MCP5077872.1 DUF1415 domain-containing protein [Psychromonas sp.]